MANDGSVAPRERVNISYKTETNGRTEEKELPFKLLVLGDFTRREDGSPVESRKPINISKDNFDDVLASQRLRVETTVPNTLAAEGGELAVSLQVRSMKDFGPEAVARQVPELSKLIELRDALNALKGPLGNIAAFRKRIQSILADEHARAQILAELSGGRPA